MNRCAYPWQQMIVDLTGEVVPCCYWSGYGNTGQPLGNTNTQSVDEIWNGPAYQDLRQRMSTGNLDGHPCGNCMSYRWSGGQFPRFTTPSAFTREQGACFIARIPDSFREQVGSQAIEVLEDGVALPHANAPHAQVREVGMGHYSVWNEWLYLSTSDNSDPALNGRFYELKCGDLLCRLDCVVADSESGRNLMQAYTEMHEGVVKMTAKPTMISLISTADCNIDCPSCSQNIVRVTKVQHRKETVPDVLNHVPYLVQFIWHGGEPFLIQRFRQFIDNFKTSDNPNLTFGFTSNGTMITAAEAEKLKKFPRLNASVSCDSFTPETYARIRAGAAYDRVMENITRLIDMYDAPVRVFSVGMIICKSNMCELADNLRYAIEHDIGLNLSPVVVYPVHEQLNVFSDFQAETRGWLAAIEAAEKVVSEAKKAHKVSVSRVDPTGMVQELRQIYERAREKYAQTVDVALTIHDPHAMLEKSAYPAVIFYDDNVPHSYVRLVPGQDHYVLKIPASELRHAGFIRVQLVHNLLEPGSVVATNMFSAVDFVHHQFFEMKLDLPEFTPQPRGRNIAWASYGEATPEGLQVREAGDVYDSYRTLYQSELPPYFGGVQIVLGAPRGASVSDIVRTTNESQRKISA